MTTDMQDITAQQAKENAMLHELMTELVQDTVWVAQQERDFQAMDRDFNINVK